MSLKTGCALTAPGSAALPTQLPFSSSADWPRQHGCPPTLTQTFGQRWSFTAMSPPPFTELDCDGPTINRMRAVRFHGPGDLRVEDLPDPDPGPGDVLVQVEVA